MREYSRTLPFKKHFKRGQEHFSMKIFSEKTSSLLCIRWYFCTLQQGFCSKSFRCPSKSVSIFASRQNSKAHYCMCFLVWIGLFRRMSPNSGLTFSFASIIFSVQNFWRLVIRAKSYYKLSTTNHNMIWCFHISPSCVCISKKYYLLSYFYNENVHI